MTDAGSEGRQRFVTPDDVETMVFDWGTRSSGCPSIA